MQYTSQGSPRIRSHTQADGRADACHQDPPLNPTRDSSALDVPGRWPGSRLHADLIQVLCDDIRPVLFPTAQLSTSRTGVSYHTRVHICYEIQWWWSRGGRLLTCPSAAAAGTRQLQAVWTLPLCAAHQCEQLWDCGGCRPGAVPGWSRFPATGRPEPACRLERPVHSLSPTTGIWTPSCRTIVPS